jgi:hypothetical protein
MRALLVVLAGVALLVGVASQPASAGKGTDIEQFMKRIEKYADTTFNSKPRGLCICMDGGAFHSQAGVLFYSGQLGDGTVSMSCSVPLFDPFGSRSGTGSCDSFEILSK